jgi:general secretion pathway protein D
LVLSNLDRPKPQVLIKVAFIEVTHNNASDIGIEGAWGKSIGQNTSANAANGFGLGNISNPMATTNLNAFGQPFSSFAAASPMTSSGAGLYQILGQDYQVTFRAIAQAGNAKILSRPSILARNNQPASIFVGQKVPLVNASRYDNYGNVINSFNYQEVGVQLNVTPFITADGLVEMIVQPAISSVDPTLSFPINGNISAPAIDERSANTVAVTPDGVTIVIGGLMTNAKSDNETKIPLLGDIPLLGNLFKRKQKSGSQTELVIFLCPHIVQAPSELAALSDKEKQKSDAVKALNEKELDKFLDTLPTKDPVSGAVQPAPGSRRGNK